MSTLVSDVIAEVEALVKAQFGLPDPDSGSVNVLTSVQAARRSFVEQMKDLRISLPCVVIELGDFEPDSDWGASNWGARRMRVSVHYIRKWGPTGNQKVVGDAVIAFANYVDSPQSTFTNFQPIEPGAVYSDVDSPVNASLLEDSAVPVIAAHAQWSPGWLVSVL